MFCTGYSLLACLFYRKIGFGYTFGMKFIFHKSISRLMLIQILKMRCKNYDVKRSPQVPHITNALDKPVLIPNPHLIMCRHPVPNPSVANVP